MYACSTPNNDFLDLDYMAWVCLKPGPTKINFLPVDVHLLRLSIAKVNFLCSRTWGNVPIIRNWRENENLGKFKFSPIIHFLHLSLRAVKLGEFLKYVFFWGSNP